MALHSIALETPNDQVVERIKEHYPNFYRINDVCWLVRSEDVSSQVADKVGLGEPRLGGATGAVMRLNGSHAGYATMSVWEWFINE